MRIEITEDALAHLATSADGDARRCLNALEIAVVTTPPGRGRASIRIDRATAEESIQKKAVVYDADGDQHYDTICAFIKSVRGSDPDAALYWLAKMLYAGEDIRFIARRIVIFASEDIGLADPHGLVLAVAAQQAVEFIGLPEAQIPLAHCTVYLATAPKSNRAYAALNAAQADVKDGVTLAVPRHLRSTGSKRAKKALGHDRLPIQPRRRGRLCAAGVSAGRPPLLRAGRAGRREAGQGAAGLLARAFRSGAGTKRRRSLSKDHAVTLNESGILRRTSAENRPCQERHLAAGRAPGWRRLISITLMSEKQNAGHF